MGDRAVLCLKDDNSETMRGDDMGVYLHWHGARTTVINFLELAKQRMGDRLGDVIYGKARLIGVIHEEIDGALGIGVGLCNELHTNNLDNGYYIINCETMTITAHYNQISA